MLVLKLFALEIVVGNRLVKVMLHETIHNDDFERNTP